MVGLGGRYTSDRGASMLEYVAVLALVAGLAAVVVLAIPAVGPTITESVSRSVCTILGGDDCGTDTADTGPVAAPDTGPDSDLDVDSDSCFFLNFRCKRERQERRDAAEEEIREALEATESGRAALEYIEDNPIDVDFNENGCSYSSGGGRINVDVTRGQEHSAGCFVHEVDHYIRDMNGERPEPGDYDNEDDYIRAMAEFEALARVAQINFHRELQDEWGANNVDLHFWDPIYDRAYDNAYNATLLATGDQAAAERAGEEAGLERLIEEYYPRVDPQTGEEVPGSGHGDYYETWQGRWEDAQCSNIGPWCPPWG